MQVMAHAQLKKNVAHFPSVMGTDSAPWSLQIVGAVLPDGDYTLMGSVRQVAHSHVFFVAFAEPVAIGLGYFYCSGVSSASGEIEASGLTSEFAGSFSGTLAAAIEKKALFAAIFRNSSPSTAPAPYEGEREPADETAATPQEAEPPAEAAPTEEIVPFISVDKQHSTGPFPFATGKMPGLFPYAPPSPKPTRAPAQPKAAAIPAPLKAASTAAVPAVQRSVPTPLPAGHAVIGDGDVEFY